MAMRPMLVVATITGARRPPVKLIHGLASTKEKANLAADRALEYSRFMDPGAPTRMGTNPVPAVKLQTAATMSVVRGRADEELMCNIKVVQYRC